MEGARLVEVAGTGVERQRWGVAEEVAVEIGFNGQAWTVVMASPLHIADLAIGLAVSEGVIAHREPLAGQCGGEENCQSAGDGAESGAPQVNVQRHLEGWSADIVIAPRRINPRAMRRRTLVGVTGCGLCGVETLADAIRHPRQRGSRAQVSGAAVARAFACLSQHQPLNAATRTVHVAAWARHDGTIALAREDVGRHNALDKLIGAMAMRHWSGGVFAPPQGDDESGAAGGFIAMSSRCSYELVVKAAVSGADMLATISAPTGMALDVAAEVGLPIACLGPDKSIVWFAPQTQSKSRARAKSQSLARAQPKVV